MRTGLIAKKLGMSSIFNSSGGCYPVTFLYIDNCQVLAVKTVKKEGYNAVVVGAVAKNKNRVSKPMRSVFENSKIEPKAKIKEFLVNENNLIDVGSELKADHYKVGQYVDITGFSIGKGFAGVMKRHNFGGLESSHGVSVSHRSHGSTGQCQDPAKVFKNKKMAGCMGNKRSTVQNLRVIDFDVKKGIILVKGNVAGAKGGYVFIRDAIKKCR